MGTPTPLNSGKTSLPLDTSKMDPQVLYQLQQQAAVNKYLKLKGTQQSFLPSVTIANNKTLLSNLSATQTKPAPKPDKAAFYVTAGDTKYNLPPHLWSLPISPGVLNNTIYRDHNSIYLSQGVASKTINHATRRAIMFRYDTTNPNYKASGTSIVTTPSNPGATTDPQYTAGPLTQTDDAWGFQFLWNPSTLTNVLTRNSNVVPSNLDKAVAQSSLFTAMEAIQFGITIDRVNDFACLKGLAVAGSKVDYSQVATTYYNQGYPTKAKQNPSDQIDELMRKGTMADVEYILRMLNSSGQNGQHWANGLNRVTADIGFLQPNPIAIQFGPNPDSLSYVGWVENLSVTHTTFTEDMIPIHTEIQVTFNAFSRIANSNAGF